MRKAARGGESQLGTREKEDGDALFQIAAMMQNGMARRPVDHLALANSWRVKMRRRVGMSAYAAIVGSAPQLMSEVNATDEGRIVHNKRAATTPIKMIAFFGCPFLSTLPIHDEPGKMPSRAIAKIRREAAVTASEVLIKSPKMATSVMTI